METRCPTAKYLKKAYLQGYRFVYDGYSSIRGDAVANIVGEKCSIVWGGLYELDKECLNSLDNFEGYPDCYTRKILSVKDDDGNEYEAWVYLREPKKIGQPSQPYRNTVYEGARNCSLPEDYIKRYILQE